MLKHRIYSYLFVFCLSFMVVPPVLTGFIQSTSSDLSKNVRVEQEDQGFDLSRLLSILVEAEEDSEEKEKEREKENKANKYDKLFSGASFLGSFIFNNKSIWHIAEVYVAGTVKSLHLPLFIQFGNFRL